MKKPSPKKVTIFSGILIAICYASIASSHQLINSLTALHAVDYFLITCGEAGSHHLFVQIDDLKVVDDRQFNVVVVKDKVAFSAMNPDGKTSPVLRVGGGVGGYHVYVSQSMSGEKAANYQLIFHCEDIDNMHSDTSVVTKIDQP